MNSFHVILAAGLLCIIAVAIVSWRQAAKADEIGELVVKTNGLPFNHVIRRDEEPKKLAAESLILRLVPGIAFAASSVGLWVIEVK